MMENQNVRVGVGVFFLRDGKVLVGLRQGAHGANTWSLPGGHLEFSESIEDCAQREVIEETGLTIGSVRAIGFTNDIFLKEDKHYITLFVAADSLSGEAERREPEKSLEWRWVTWPEIPTPIFLPLQNFIQAGMSPLKK